MRGQPAVPALSWRLATVADEARLRHFRCSSGLPWEDEVERHIRHHAVFFATGRGGHLCHRMWVIEATGEIVATGAHEEATDLVVGGRPASFLPFIAVARRWTGPRPPDGIRIADILLRVLLEDLAASTPPRAPWVFAHVHRENARSLRLFERVGFAVVTAIAARSPEYVVVGTRA